MKEPCQPDDPRESRERRTGWAVAMHSQTEWQAHIARDLLIEQGIPSVVRSYLVGPYGGALSAHMPWAAEVLVPNTCLSDARSLIEAMLTSNGE